MESRALAALFENDLERGRAALKQYWPTLIRWTFDPAGSDLGFGFSTRGRDPVFWEYAYGNLVLLHATGKLAGETLAAFLRATTARSHYAAGLNLFPLETIQELQLSNLLNAIEQQQGICPVTRSPCSFLDVFRKVSVSSPKLLLQVTSRLLGPASGAFSAHRAACVPSRLV